MRQPDGDAGARRRPFDHGTARRPSPAAGGRVAFGFNYGPEPVDMSAHVGNGDYVLGGPGAAAVRRLRHPPAMITRR